MSYSFDANVLLYASDRSSERHDAPRVFLEKCAAQPEVLCLAWPTLMAYLRIATHPGIFARAAISSPTRTSRPSSSRMACVRCTRATATFGSSSRSTSAIPSHRQRVIRCPGSRRWARVPCGRGPVFKCVRSRAAMGRDADVRRLSPPAHAARPSGRRGYDPTRPASRRSR
jgi:hypothetical protein